MYVCAPVYVCAPCVWGGWGDDGVPGSVNTEMSSRPTSLSPVLGSWEEGVGWEWLLCQPAKP